jgi:competence protein ComEC
MPRSGWLAIGAVIAALFLTGPLGGPRSDLGLASGATAVLALAMLVRRAGGPVPAGLGPAALGLLVVALRLLPASASATATWTGPLPSGDGPWIGVVETVGAPRAAERPAVVAIETPAGLRVAATLPVFPAVVPGDRVRVGGSLRPPPASPYGDYLARVGASATVRVTSLALEPSPGDPGRSLEGLRRGADAALRLAIPEPEAGLASGVLVGLRDRVDRDLTAAFTVVGATHVVAISGWNIAIVATMLAALAGRIARRRRAALTAVAILAYVVFVGPSGSVVRAAGMAGVVMLARELGRPSSAAAAIGWAVAALLLVDPRTVADAGFQLSTVATAGLIAWGTPLSGWLAGSAPGRVRGWLAESLGVSLAAQAATLPIILASFGRLSLVSPAVNLGVVPLVAPAMAAGAVALAGGVAGLAGIPVIATLAGLPAWAAFGAIVGLVRAGAALPFASVVLEPPWNLAAAAIAAALVGAVVVMARGRRPGGRDSAPPPGPARGAPARASPSLAPAAARRRPARGWVHGRRGRLLVAALAIAVAATCLGATRRPDGVPRVVVLDVGQGDAILVEGGRGGRMLVDGGPDPGRLQIALDERLPPWDRRIDVIVLTHPHEDHAAGLAALVERYAVGRLLEPGMIGPGPGYAALEAAAAARMVPHGRLATGDRLEIDDFRFRVLWPDPGTVPERPADGGTAINDVSIVLLGEVGSHRVLLTGDIEEGVDPALAARGLPTVELLKVAHHGSRTASTMAFLAAIRPSLAIISVGAGNSYGHPTRAALDRLAAVGAQVRRTDLDGTVDVELGPGPIRVHESGGRRVAAASGDVAVPAAVPAISGAWSAATRPGAPSPTRAIPAFAGRPDRPAPNLAPPAPELALGYDAPRDRPDESRHRRLLLGRRRLRGGRRGGGLPRGSDPVPDRGARTLAGPGRGQRSPTRHRRDRDAPRNRHDVRIRDPGHPVQRGPARPPQRRPRCARGRDRADRGRQRAGGRGGDGFGQEGSAVEGPLGRRQGRRR